MPAWVIPLWIAATVSLFLVVAAQFLNTEADAAILMTLGIAGPGIALIAAHKRFFNLKTLALPGVALFAYGGFVAIPALFVFFDRDDDPSRYTYLAGVLSVLITFPLGVLLGDFLAGARHPRVTREIVEINWRRLRIVWDIMLLLGLIIAGLHFYEVGYMPLWNAISLKGDWEALAELREEAGTLLPGVVNHYLYTWNRIILLPGLAALALGSYYIRRTRGWFFRSGVALAAAVFHGTLTLEKSYGMTVIIVLGISLYLQGERKIRLRYVLLLLMAASAFPMFMFWWIVPGGLGELLVAVVHRLFYVPAEVTFLYFSLIPHQLGFLYGASSRFLSLLTGRQFFDVANYLFRQEFPDWIESGTANACFLASAWADFGWVGVIFEGVLAGMIVHALDRIVRDREDIISKTLHVLFIVPFTVGFTSVPFQVVLLSYGVLPSIAGARLLRRFISGGKAGLTNISISRS